MRKRPQPLFRGRLGLCALLFLFNISPAHGDPGDLDSGFGANGLVVTAGNNSASGGDVAIQPDGKIVAVGTGAAVFRYNPDGQLDSTFGPDGTGKVVTNPGGMFDAAQGVALAPDGKILVVGFSFLNDDESDLLILRYHPDGNLDDTFNGSGFRLDSFSDDIDFAEDVLVQPDGKIVVVGGSEQNQLIARYNEDGSPDPSFNGSGFRIINQIVSSDFQAVVLQSDGKLIAAGRVGAGPSAPQLVRFEANGALDGDFGQSGAVTPDWGGNFGTINDVGIQSDGKIVYAGILDDGGPLQILAGRVDASGAEDPGFNGTGFHAFAPGSGDAEGRGLTLQADGQTVVVGRTVDPDPPNLRVPVVARFNMDGSLDSGFGSSLGYTLLHYPEFVNLFSFGAVAAVLQADGRIVSLGGWFDEALEPHNSFALARLDGNSAQLSLSLIPNTEAAEVGSAVTYTLTLQNLGPDRAGGVQVRNDLPAGTSFSSGSAECGLLEGTIHCEVGTLEVQEEKTLALTLTMPNQPATVVTTAVAGGQVLIPDPGQAAASATVTVAGGGRGSSGGCSLQPLSPGRNVSMALAACFFALTVVGLFRRYSM